MTILHKIEQKQTKKIFFMKNIQHIITDIDRIRQIIEQWNENQNIPAIERDIVLDKLKHLYEILLTETVIDFSDMGSEQEAGPSLASGSVTDNNSTVQSVASVSDISAAEKPEKSDNTFSTMSETVSETILGSVSHFGSTEENKDIEQKLFGDDQIPRPKVDKQVILSLYGDAPTPPRTAPTPPVYPPVETPPPFTPQPAVPIEQPKRTPYASEPSPVSPASPEANAAPHKKVFGEVLSDNGSIPMNEALGKQNSHTDVASKLQAKSINGDLRQHIGINDRFMIIRNLFGGSSEAFNATMAQLNTFTDLDDALLYIQDHYNWNPDDESVKLIVDLLERKLG